MNKYLKNLLKGLGVTIILSVIAFYYFIVTLEIDLTHCQETDASYVLENGYAEYEIGELYTVMYTKEFDLNYYDVKTYKQLATTSVDFTIGHIYLKTPEGIYYACGWYK